MDYFKRAVRPAPTTFGKHQGGVYTQRIHDHQYVPLYSMLQSILLLSLTVMSYYNYHSLQNQQQQTELLTEIHEEMKNSHGILKLLFEYLFNNYLPQILQQLKENKFNYSTPVTTDNPWTREDIDRLLAMQGGGDGNVTIISSWTQADIDALFDLQTQIRQQIESLRNEQQATLGEFTTTLTDITTTIDAGTISAEAGDAAIVAAIGAASTAIVSEIGVATGAQTAASAAAGAAAAAGSAAAGTALALELRTTGVRVVNRVDTTPHFLGRVDTDAHFGTVDTKPDIGTVKTEPQGTITVELTQDQLDDLNSHISNSNPFSDEQVTTLVANSANYWYEDNVLQALDVLSLISQAASRIDDRAEYWSEAERLQALDVLALISQAASNISNASSYWSEEERLQALDVLSMVSQSVSNISQTFEFWPSEERLQLLDVLALTSQAVSSLNSSANFWTDSEKSKLIANTDNWDGFTVAESLNNQAAMAHHLLNLSSRTDYWGNSEVQDVLNRLNSMDNRVSQLYAEAYYWSQDDINNLFNLISNINTTANITVPDGAWTEERVLQALDVQSITSVAVSNIDSRANYWTDEEKQDLLDSLQTSDPQLPLIQRCLAGSEFHGRMIRSSSHSNNYWINAALSLLPRQSPITVDEPFDYLNEYYGYDLTTGAATVALIHHVTSDLLIGISGHLYLPHTNGAWSFATHTATGSLDEQGYYNIYRPSPYIGAFIVEQLQADPGQLNLAFDENCMLSIQPYGNK